MIIVSYTQGLAVYSLRRYACGKALFLFIEKGAFFVIMKVL